MVEFSTVIGNTTVRRRTDGNQAEIISSLRKSGISVVCLSSLGGGVPDLLCGVAGVNYLLEVKNLVGRGCKFTPDEERFMSSWRGQYAVVFSPEQALKVVTNVD